TERFRLSSKPSTAPMPIHPAFFMRSRIATSVSSSSGRRLHGWEIGRQVIEQKKYTPHPVRKLKRRPAAHDGAAGTFVHNLLLVSTGAPAGGRRPTGGSPAGEMCAVPSAGSGEHWSLCVALSSGARRL